MSWQKCQSSFILCHMRRVILAGYEGAQGLDVFGPAEVFAGVGRLAGLSAYEVVVGSIGGLENWAASGGAPQTPRLLRHPAPESRILLVVGGGTNARPRAVPSAAPR